MIKYTIKEYGTMPDNERYVVGFGITNTENDRGTYLQCYVPIEGNETKSEAEVCQLAFSSSYDAITSYSGKLEIDPSVIGTEFIPPDM